MKRKISYIQRGDCEKNLGNLAYALSPAKTRQVWAGLQTRTPMANLPYLGNLANLDAFPQVRRYFPGFPGFPGLIRLANSGLCTYFDGAMFAQVTSSLPLQPFRRFLSGHVWASRR